MNRFFWLLNGALLVVGLLVTLAALRFEPAHPAPGSDATATDEPRPGKTAGGMRQPAAANRPPPRGPSPETVDLIWKQSLFRPDRGEDGAESGAAGTESTRATDMELVGIGQINGEGAAIILIQNGASGMLPPGRRPDLPDTPGMATPFGRRGAAGGLRRTPPGRTGTARGGGESSGQPHVFRVNQRVGTSGFVVKEVRIDTVVLLRGAEERVLKLDRGDASSKTRQESATRDALSRVPIVVTPPPPPMPGAPGQTAFPGGVNAPPAFNPGQPAAAGTPGALLSREERIRSAIETRRRLMMNAQQPQNTPPRP